MLNSKTVKSNLFSIRVYIIQTKAREVDTPIKPINKRTVTDATRARIRYVGGYCIAAYIVSHKFVTKKASCLKQGERSVFENTDKPSPF